MTDSKDASDPAALSASLSKVCEHVFVGGYRAACNGKLMEKHGIRRILKLFEGEAGYTRHKGIDYLVADIKDGDTDGFVKALRGCVLFIRKGTGPVLVHCHMGVSRSPSVVIAHLMFDHGMDYATALATVSKAHPQTEIKFAKQLQDIGSMLARRRQ